MFPPNLLFQPHPYPTHRCDVGPSPGMSSFRILVFYAKNWQYLLGNCGCGHKSLFCSPSSYPLELKVVGCAAKAPGRLSLSFEGKGVWCPTCRNAAQRLLWRRQNPSPVCETKHRLWSDWLVTWSQTPYISALPPSPPPPPCCQFFKMPFQEKRKYHFTL